ncbi:ATP-dependent helicase HrpA [hydrothermal vent metagenome]|uniref:RNA helicase n=1 Tax=hydrothermal vent metagenome TaxID=652676 RepID=A0A3B0YR85_9ZZZZ
MLNSNDIIYPPDLPVVAERERILAAIDNNQVIIIAGETGSGKTTQLPKMCLELGYGKKGLIGHTQPRRIAARSVAERIAEELKVPAGTLVGYQIRFHEQLSAKTELKLMTDGILLAEIQRDPSLKKYSAIIIDEAHERSLNIDFLLGYLKRLLPKRPDLKLIITSATIDTVKFSQHFLQAPVIEVTGRSYPVEVRYRPFHQQDEMDQDNELQQGVLNAMHEILLDGPGDVLIFLSGERDIRETSDLLLKHFSRKIQILPLYARLSVADQSKVFKTGGLRRVVLATNVAETSLTVPGICYVIDPGYARISRYSHRHKVQRLPIEKISQASANQRAGRCGRVAPGVCIRLYEEDDFNNRDEFTEPEIMRTNLASVILKMLAVGLGKIEEFPFIDMPEQSFINDGFRLLTELAAVNNDRQLTRLGRKLSQFPIDPRLSRMLLAAEQLGCLAEVLVIVSALSIQDPRERPLEYRQKADEAHVRFEDKKSDYSAILNLWNFVREQQQALSNSQFRKMCRSNFISWLRLREWQDLYKQLKGSVAELKLSINPAEANYDSIHQALLTGLLSFIGNQSERSEYNGSHNKRFHIMPGTPLFKHPPKWIMAAEIVETTKLYARRVATIEVQWLEKAAKPLLKFSHSDPYWSKKQARVLGHEKVSLYGLVIIPDRRVAWAKISPLESRKIFIEQGLVAGELTSKVEFVRHNLQLLSNIEDMEDKIRKRGILLDETTLVEFYEERLPLKVNDGQSFTAWAKTLKQVDIDHLKMSQQALLKDTTIVPQDQAFPSFLYLGDNKFALTYQFNPGKEQDGVTVSIPQAALHQLKSEPFEYLVPGLLQEKIVTMLKLLPKSLRRNFVPVPEYAQACLQSLAGEAGACYSEQSPFMTDSHSASLVSQISRQLLSMTGIRVNKEQWQAIVLPDHLKMYFRVIDQRDQVICEGNDLEKLQQNMNATAVELFDQKSKLVDKGSIDNLTSKRQASSIEQSGTIIERWETDIEEVVERTRDGLRLQLYPALALIEGHIRLVECHTPEQVQRLMPAALCELFRKVRSVDVKYLSHHLPEINRLCLMYSVIDTCDNLKEEMLIAITQESFLHDHQKIRTQKVFDDACEKGVSCLMEVANQFSRVLKQTLTLYNQIQVEFDQQVSSAQTTVEDIEQQLEWLVYPGFLLETPWEQLQYYPRYLQAIMYRLDKVKNNPGRDQMQINLVLPWQDHYYSVAELEYQTLNEELNIDRFRWMIEEYRVSLFAQHLKTAQPISDKRLAQQWKKLSA